jgi:hypothetical protein
VICNQQKKSTLQESGTCVSHIDLSILFLRINYVEVLIEMAISYITLLVVVVGHMDEHDTNGVGV